MISNFTQVSKKNDGLPAHAILDRPVVTMKDEKYNATNHSTWLKLQNSSS